MRSPSCVAQLVEEHLGGGHRAQQVDVDHLPDLGLLLRGERPQQHHARVVDEDVGAAELGVDALGRGDHRVAVGDVGRDRDGAVAELGRQRLDAVGAAGQQGEAVAGGGQGAGGRLADAGGRAGDDRDAAGICVRAHAAGSTRRGTGSSALRCGKGTSEPRSSSHSFSRSAWALLRDGDHRRAREHRLLLVRGAQAVVRDLRAEVVDVVVVGVADDPGQRPRELEVRAALQRGELELPVARGLVVGLLVLVLDVEHPGADRPRPRGVVPWIIRKVCQPSERAPAHGPDDQGEVGHHDAEQDPRGHAALREAALEQEHEARADDQHQQRVAVQRGSRAGRRREARWYSARVIV